MTAEWEALQRDKAILGEMFENYAIVVQYDDGSVFHDGNNEIVERALYQEALAMIEDEREWLDADVDVDLDWDE